MAISKSYVGIGNETKEIKNAYVGYNNKAILLPIFASGGGIVTWHDGTDEQIASMLDAYYSGQLDVHDYWAVGDERTVSLSAMSATGVGESHVAQDVTMVLVHDNGNELVTPSGSISNAAFIIQQKDCLANGGHMNNSRTNSGSWNGCARKTWCDNVYYNALPSTLKPIFKQVGVKTIDSYNGSTMQTSNCYIFLPAEREIFDSRSHSNQTEWNNLTQWEYYKTASNRIKKMGSSGSAYRWWERSPHKDDSYDFCCVDSDGNANVVLAWDANGIAPGGCV